MPEILSAQPAYQKYEAKVCFLNLGAQSKNFEVWLEDKVRVCSSQDTCVFKHP